MSLPVPVILVTSYDSQVGVSISNYSIYSGVYQFEITNVTTSLSNSYAITSQLTLRLKQGQSMTTLR